MFFKDINKKTQEGRPFECPKLSKANEQFCDITDKKVYISRVRREYLSRKILFDINLEERRGKLRRMLENENDQLINENLDKMDTIETRKYKLKDEAVRIRNQTELERQEIAMNKIKNARRLNDDRYRQSQIKSHRMLIKEDWDKLTDIKNRIKREEMCEEKFWNAKVMEKTEDMLAREIQIQNKKDDFKNDCLEQLASREKERNNMKDLEKENRENNLKRFYSLNEELKNDEINKYQKSIKDKKNYHAILDKHMEQAKIMKDRNMNYEKCFDDIMKDENRQRLKNNEQISWLKKRNDMKMITNFIDYNNCLKEKDKDEDKEINKQVNKMDKELHQKRVDFERDKLKKYQDLISGIKSSQKFQMKEAEKKKELAVIEGLKEREIFNNLYLEGIKKDELKLVERKKFVKSYNDTLKLQILYNEKLKEIRHMEHEREKNSMLEAEKEYNRKRTEILANEKLFNIHPSRIKN